MFDLIATGEYYAEVGTALSEKTPQDLRQALEEVCEERLRRIDRFTQLALLGSGRCVAGVTLAERTGLYISSGFGSIANTIAVQRRIFEEHQIPKPVNFINTLSNSAGYYVARNLDLHSRNLFVGRDAAPTEAAVRLATVDLALGNVEQALVGIVDEGSWPLADHARRLGAAPHAKLAEGSHWLLLQSHSSDASGARIGDVRTLNGPDELSEWFGQTGHAPDAKIYLAPGVEPDISAACPPLDAFTPSLGGYMARTAGAVIRFLDSSESGELLTVAGGDERIHVMHLMSS